MPEAQNIAAQSRTRELSTSFRNYMYMILYTVYQRETRFVLLYIRSLKEQKNPMQ